MIKTLRRDKLLRLAKAGRLVLVDSYHYDEMTGSQRGGPEMPVRIREQPHDWLTGYCNLGTYEFTNKSGRAWQEENGLVTLYYHSNCNYTFRILDEAPKAEPAAATEVAVEIVAEPVKKLEPAIEVIGPDSKSVGQCAVCRGELPGERVREVRCSGRVVKSRYVCLHDVMGQPVVDVDVSETSIAMGQVLSKGVQQ